MSRLWSDGRPFRPLRPGLAPPVTPLFAGLAVVLAGLAFVLGHALTPPGGAPGPLAALAVFGVAAALAVRSMRSRYPHPVIGFCNAATLLRAALAAALVAPILSLAGGAVDDRLLWSLLAVALVALALDGVDGWLARRTGLVSEFGARFDMEVDALFGLILSVLVLATGKVGPYVLALGTMRYAYLGAALVIPWLNIPLPQRFRRKAICVVQIAALIALVAPAVTPPLATVVAVLATALLAWSFAVDIVWQAARR